MRVLTSEAAAKSAGPIPAGYRQRWLKADNPEHVAMVQAFADRSDPDDVEEAALDEMDSFDEHAINVLVVNDDVLVVDDDVLVPEGQAEQIVAYASAALWDWDADFADIGVRVDPDHRSKGLGTLVVAYTVAALQADGLLPLYRHGHHNPGSRRIAELIGFEVATTLWFFAPPTDR